MKISPLCIGLLCISTTAFAAVRPRHAVTTHPRVAHGSSRRASRHAATTAHAKGKHGKAAAAASRPTSAGMDSERATQIQTALIRSGYLSGEATGKWDATSAAAMQKLQSDNGWQTKVVPDARALIKLGLGPKP